MSAHSTVVGGSSAERVKMCPASVKLSENIPPSPPSPYAQEGTALHTVMEQVLLDPEKHGMADKGPDHKFVPTKDFIGMTIDGVEITKDLYYDKLVPAGIAVHDVFRQYGVCDYEPEAVVRSKTIEGAFGTCDILAVCDNATRLVIDFKFGDGYLVSPDKNAQLLFYGGVALEDPECDWWSDGYQMDDKLALVIIQPAQDPVHAVYETEVAEATTLLAELTISLGSVNRQHLDPNPGSWCKWCPAAPICPAKRGDAREALSIDPETTAALSRAMSLIDKLEPWIKQVRGKVHELMDQGAEIPGYKLVETVPRRVWIDQDGVEDKLHKMRKFKRSDYMTEKLVSPPQLEKVCKSKDVDFSVFDAYHDKVSSGTAVVAEDNPRPAITSKKGKRDLTQMETEPETETEK
jgi:hypothetical protein